MELWQIHLLQVYVAHNKIYKYCKGPCGSDGKESAWSTGDSDSIPGSRRSPGEGNDNPLQYCCLENSNGQRSLVGYSSWDCKELDMIEWPTDHIKYYCAAAAAKSLQLCPILCDPIDTRLPCPWDSPGKNTGVGCHFLLQCRKVKSESEVA